MLEFNAAEDAIYEEDGSAMWREGLGYREYCFRRQYGTMRGLTGWDDETPQWVLEMDTLRRNPKVKDRTGTFFTSVGWPLVSFTGQAEIVRVKDKPRRGTTSYVVSTPHQVMVFGPDGPMSDAFYDALIIPYRPVVAGFLIDSVFWSATVWAACRVVQIVVRKNRRSRGRCENCGHLMAPGGGGRCPECGE